MKRKIIIDFSQCSLYNVIIKYLWFADSKQSICVSKRLKVYAFGRFFCFLYITSYLTVVTKHMDSILAVHALFYIFPRQRASAKTL